MAHTVQCYGMWNELIVLWEALVQISHLNGSGKIQGGVVNPNDDNLDGLANSSHF